MPHSPLITSATLPRAMVASIIFLAVFCVSCENYKGNATLTTKQSVPLGVAFPSTVATTENNGSTSGIFSPSSNSSQLMSVSGSSPVAGSSIMFPPGALAIGTEITIQAGPNLASDSVVQQLDLGTMVTASAQTVSIFSSEPMDALVPFTVSVPAPTTSGLNLNDPYANLIILYHITKVSEGNTNYTGIMTRDLVKYENGFASFDTKYFGSFQAMLTAHPIKSVVEVSGKPDIPDFGGGRLFFVAGPSVLSFQARNEAVGQSSGGLSAWMHTRSPGVVGGPRIIQTDFRSRTK